MAEGRFAEFGQFEIVEMGSRIKRDPLLFERKFQFPLTEDDGSGGRRVVENEHDYVVRIAWVPIVVAAASALVQAFAAKIGENIADGIFESAVSGENADQRWRDEVLQRLFILERKVDAILLELQAIPTVVREVVRAENIRIQVSDIQSRIVQVGTYFGAWLDNRTDSSRLADLRNVISRLLTDVSSLLRQEQYRYALVMQALIAVIPIVRFVAEDGATGDHTILRFLGEPCRDIRDLCNQILDASNEGSIANVHQHYANKLASATADIAELQNAGQFRFVIGGPWKLDPPRTDVWYTRTAFLTVNADGVTSGIGGVNRDSLQIIDPPAPDDGDGRLQGSLLSWWPPARGHFNMDPGKGDMKALFHEHFQEKVQHRFSVKIGTPPIINILESHKSAVQALRDACDSLSPLTV
jgi:hypothetical protein